MKSSQNKRVGQATRGKTALNRLRQVDIYLLLAWPEVLRRPGAWVVDLGYGAYPWTALEMWERWRPLNPSLQLLGLEIDPERVARAQAMPHPPGVAFALGGFNVGAYMSQMKPGAQVIRAYNVLRQYDEDQVGPALALMAEALAPGGLLIEGTSTPSGNWVAFDLYQKTPAGLIHRALVFGTNFREPPGPLSAEAFQAILPKRLIHHMRDPRPARFFATWERELRAAYYQGQYQRRGQWAAAARALAQKWDSPLDLRPRLLERGFLSLYESLLPPLTV
jgi:hypothetical protein